MLREFDAYRPFWEAEKKKEELIDSNINKNMRERDVKE